MASKLRLNFRHLVGGLYILMALGPLSAMAADKWQGQVPKVASQTDDWNALIPLLMSHGMHYGALAGARNILNFFTDLNSKELAYGTIIAFVDWGYPFSTRADFVPGDIDPTGPGNFAQSYLLYKAMVNRDKKMDKWADYYFNKIDKENFPKYIFFRATDAYVKGQSEEAITLLKKALQVTHGADYLSLVKKEARTLARIYYERTDYAKSLEVYENFLLKLNPLEPTDWIEAAWNLYQLKRFPEAMGLLYNLESKAGGGVPLPEKYVLRGLINREYCSTVATDQLIKSFTTEFGATINGIKLGEPLSKFPQLAKIELPEAQQYRQFVLTLEQLDHEAKQIDSLPEKLRPLATYIYANEITMLQRQRQIYQDYALEGLARHLVILGESLKFLKFDVAREKFNPDRVFAEEAVAPEKLVESTDEQSFRLHWIQWGDYWRDERLLYKGLPKTKCDR